MISRFDLMFFPHLMIACWATWGTKGLAWAAWVGVADAVLTVLFREWVER